MHAYVLAMDRDLKQNIDRVQEEDFEKILAAFKVASNNLITSVVILEGNYGNGGDMILDANDDLEMSYKLRKSTFNKSQIYQKHGYVDFVLH